MYKFDLRLFDADGASDGGTAENAQEVSQPANESGVSTDHAEMLTQTAEQEDREAKYRELLKEYKDLDDKRIQDTIKKRLKGTNQMRQQLEALNDAVLPLYQAHGIAPGDVAALSQAIQNDDSYWERGAEDAGMTVEQYKQMQFALAENEQLRRSIQQQQQEEAAHRQIAAWQQEAETLRQIYPEFDLMKEIQNSKFAGLIAAKNEETRVSLQTAYEVCHMDEMRQMAARNAAKAAESNTIQSIRAGAHRPKEAGSGTEAAVTQGKIDITKLTREQRREIERRAERGERITLQEGSLPWKM